MADNEHWGFSTQAIRTGHERSPEGEHCEPIFPTSSFVFRSAAQAAARFSGDERGNIYSRFTNPTVDIFEQRLAAMEGAERCVATSSGMSAILAVCLGLLQTGDHIISSRSVFGTTSVLFTQFMTKFGVETSFVDLEDLNAWHKAVKPNTQLLFLETPSNPLGKVGDLRKLSELAKQTGAYLAVDNVFCTPVLQQPLKLGADLVVHSATKYIDGQGRSMGGAVVGSEELVGDKIYSVLRTCGMSLSPFNAWLFLKGLETLELRMQKHCDNAQLLAEWLAQHPNVTHVHFPGLTTHPQYDLIQAQQSGPGGVLSFEIKGGRDEAWRFIDQQGLMSITANLGDTKSIVTHPATTTHSRISAEEKLRAGISESLIRIAVGLENSEDLIAAAKRGLQ